MEEELKEKIATGVVTGVAIAGILASGGVETDQLPAAEEAASAEAKIQYVELRERSAQDVIDEFNSKYTEEDTQQQTEKKGSLLRSFIAVPLWAAFCFLLNLLDPVLVPALRCGLTAAGILGAAAAGIKTVFPDVPLKKILNKKSLSAVFVIIAAVSVGDTALYLFWPRYRLAVNGFRFVAGLLGIAAAVLAVNHLLARKTKA